MKRKSIEVKGFSHGAQPIPAASRKGNIVATGGIYGLDRESASLPDAVERQTALMFDNLQLVLEAAGATFADVVKMTFWVKAAEAKPLINEHWQRCFPNPDSRPARHTLQNDHLPANMLVQCDALAIIEK